MATSADRMGVPEINVPTRTARDRSGAPKVPRPRHLRRPLVVSGAVAATKSDPVDDEYFA
jgi:hypothetical protein